MTQCASAMGGGRPRTKSNPRSNLGRSMTYVRLQCSTLTSTRDRQPLGSSPNHAHATEDNTPCWGESAVATRVLTQTVAARVFTTHALSPQQENNAYACGGLLALQPSRYTTGLNPVVVPHTTIKTQLVTVVHVTFPPGLNHGRHPYFYRMDGDARRPPPTV